MMVNKIRMFREDGSRVLLSDILERVPVNDFNWSIIEFTGIGTAPKGLSMEEFEDNVISSPIGYTLNSNELKELSNNLEQTIECLIVGYKKSHPLTALMVENEDYSSCNIIIRALDSTEWEVVIKEQ